MLNRRIFSLVAILVVAVLVLPMSSSGQDQGKKEQHAHKEHFDKCAKACNDCQRICDACATHCAHLVAEGKKEHLTTLNTCRDCADFCSTAAEIVARGGPFADLICKSCAEACKRCGTECKKHQDKMMQQCAEECFRCEKACLEMLQHVGHDKEGAKTGAVHEKRDRK